MGCRAILGVGGSFFHDLDEMSLLDSRKLDIKEALQFKHCFLRIIFHGYRAFCRH